MRRMKETPVSDVSGKELDVACSIRDRAKTVVFATRFITALRVI